MDKEIFEQLVKEFSDDGLLGGIYMAIPTGEVLASDSTFIEVLIYGKSFYAKPCMSFGSMVVPNKQWLDKYKDEVFVAVGFENGNPAHPIYLGAVQRSGRTSDYENYPAIKSFKSVEFKYVIDDIAKTFTIEKIDSKGNVTHSATLGATQTRVGDSDNSITLDYAKNSVRIENRKKQIIHLSDVVELGKGTERQSAILGEKLIGTMQNTLEEVKTSLGLLATAKIIVNPSTFIGVLDPNAITNVQKSITNLTKLNAELLKSLSINVKLD